MNYRVTNFVNSDQPSAPEAQAPNGEVTETTEGDAEDAGDGSYTYLYKMCISRRIADFLKLCSP